MHFLRLFELLQGRRDVLENVAPELRHWLNFLAFGGLKEEREMSQLVEHDPLVMEAVTELQRSSADPDMRELERRRKLWKLEYYSGLEAAKEEGEARGKAEAVLTNLRTRFGKVPKEIETVIGKMTDATALDSWVAFAVTCRSLEEFEKALK